MKQHLLLFLLIPGTFLSCTRAAQDTSSGGAMGPLRVCVTNSRYFATPDGRPVYLTGSHTWQSLQDGVLSNYTTVRQPFDYTGYLNLLQTNHHNFIRLWRWELTTHQPQPWLRTGPGQALDGKPKFDLRKFNQPYFDRLRSRVIAARDRGIYVSIMLFEDWIFMNKRDDYPVEQHPFHKDNNVSGINGDPNGDRWGVEIHTLQAPEILEIQKAYVRKVVQTVNDLDNVLYEICNEGVRHTRDWQYEMVRFIKNLQANMPKQHPVGMTSVGDMNDDCSKSAADWTSLATIGWDQPKDPWTSDPPAADGHKVDLLDTDHIGWKVFIDDATFTRAWVWKSFIRGHNTLLMENLADSAGWIAGRTAMGHTRRLSERVNLASLAPHPELASTRYCLAHPGQEYLVYLPEGGSVTVDLSAVSGPLAVEWIHAADASRRPVDTVAGGGQRVFKVPFTGDAVLHIRKGQGKEASGAAGQPASNRAEAAGLVLGIDGTAFTINGKKTFLLGASYYGALGAPDDFIARDLDDLQTLGFNWIRVWAVWDLFDDNVSAVDSSGRAREPYLTRLKAVVTAAEKRGMVVDVTLARMLPCLPNQEAHLLAAETLAKALKGCRNVYFDLANERDQHYDAVFVSYPELRALRDRVKAVDADRLVTASGDPTDRADLSRYLVEAGLDFISPHLARDAGTEQRTVDATRKYFGWMKELGRSAPIHYQEPFRRDYLDYRGFWQPEVGTFCTDLRNAKLGGAAGWCFHNGSPTHPERFPAGKRRSFDMRPSQGRLMDQLDEVERQFLKRAMSCVQ